MRSVKYYSFISISFRLSGISPFAGDSQVETFQNILECSVTFDREEFVDISEEARDFINCLLRKNPKQVSVSNQHDSMLIVTKHELNFLCL